MKHPKFIVSCQVEETIKVANIVDPIDMASKRWLSWISSTCQDGIKVPGSSGKKVNFTWTAELQIIFYSVAVCFVLENCYFCRGIFNIFKVILCKNGFIEHLLVSLK